MKKTTYLFDILLHPINGFEELKYRKQFSVRLSFVIVLLFFLVEVFRFQLTGFGFNANNPNDLNVLFIFASTIMVFFFWVLSNWLICSLLEGKGFLKEVWASSAYALVPYVLVTFITTIISNFVVSEEITLINYAYFIGIIWSSVFMIIALKAIHEYSISKTLVVIILTILGVSVILFLILLSFTVYQQVYNMFKTIFSEVMFRL